MDTVLDLDELERPEREDDGDRELDADLMEVVLRYGLCPRCHYDTDEDGYCAICGATLGRA